MLFLRNLNQVSRRFSTNINEVYKEMSKTWWANSENEPLFIMNQLRVPLIREALINSSNFEINKSKPLSGFNLLDIGCGVGFLSESLARLGANMVSVDPEEQNIKHAKLHLENDPEIRNRIDYKCCHAEDLITDYSGIFDAVIASEVVEHVETPMTLVETAVDLTKEGGSLFFTTLNRTWLSYITAIILAEKVFQIIPHNTHDWNMFVKPEELKLWMENKNCHLRLVHGMKYNPFTKRFYWCSDASDGYAVHGIKN